MNVALRIFRKAFFIMTEMKNYKYGIHFPSSNLSDALNKNEALEYGNALRQRFTVTEMVAGKETHRDKYQDILSWHHLLTTPERQHLRNIRAIEALKDYGYEVDQESINKTQEMYDAMQKRYDRDMLTIDEVKKTPQYARAVELVKARFGGTLKNGAKLFDYQIEGAALMIAKKQLLLAFDMGLGKTITSLVGVASDPANKKILIITMSRNINDWIKELRNLGLDNEFIILQNPYDIKSSKRFHIVSYEKWAGTHTKTTYLKKLHERCPSCNSHFKWHKGQQYCFRCKSKQQEERYSQKNLPEKCPACSKDWKHGKEFCQCGFTVVESKKKSLSNYYKNNSYDACVVDEIQFIRNGDSKRSQAVRKVNTKVRVGLSGTPAENGADDLYYILMWLTGGKSRFENPMEHDRFPRKGKKGEEHFRIHYGGGAKERVLDTKEIKARASHKEELWNLLDTVMIRKTKQDSEVMASIKVPKPIHKRMHLEMNDSDRELYQTILDAFREWYETELAKKEAAEAKGQKYKINSIEICAWMDKLRKAASCPWTFKEYKASKNEDPTKITYIKNKASDYLRRGKKILIFTSHKATAEHLGLLLDGILPRTSAGFIHGDVKMDYRFELMNRFQDPNDDLSILIMTTKTGAESYTLTEAKAVFLYDLDFNGKKLEQCYSRAVRLGQKDTVDVHWMIAVDTIDSNMHGLVLSKVSGVDLAVDRKELDFQKIASEFEGDSSISEDLDYEAFAGEMLARGTSREQAYAS